MSIPDGKYATRPPRYEVTDRVIYEMFKMALNANKNLTVEAALTNATSIAQFLETKGIVRKVSY